MNKRLSEFFATVLVTAMLLSTFPFVVPTKAAVWPPASPAFWVMPQMVDFTASDASVGTLFNVTVMAAAVNGTDCWSVQLGFNASQLQVVTARLTNGATSLLFKGHSSTPLGPIIDNIGQTAGYPGVGSVEISESLIGTDYIAAASASVFYVTFNVTAVPAAGQTLSSLIDPAFGLPPVEETLFILQSPTTQYPTSEIDNPNTAPCLYSYSYMSHDVSVINVTSKTVVCQSYGVNVTVTAVDPGSFAETFNVTVYANTTIIASQNVTLSAGNSTITNFVWNTTGFAKGNYVMGAYAWPVPGETNTANNNCTGGWVVVTMVGDVTGPSGVPDGQVDIRDVHYVAVCYGTNSTSPNWNPNADINNDGQVDIRDVHIAALNYGKTDP